MQQSVHDLDARLAPLAAALEARPAVAAVIDGSLDAGGLWSVYLSLDMADPAAWEEVRRLAWLFNNLYEVVPDAIMFRPVVVEDQLSGERHLCWVLESLSADYSPDRALDRLLTPLPSFLPALASAG